MSITSSTPSRTHSAMVALLVGHGAAGRQRRGVYLHSCMQSGNLTYEWGGGGLLRSFGLNSGCGGGTLVRMPEGDRGLTSRMRADGSSDMSALSSSYTVPGQSSSGVRPWLKAVSTPLRQADNWHDLRGDEEGQNVEECCRDAGCVHGHTCAPRILPSAATWRPRQKRAERSRWAWSSPENCDNS